MGTNIRSYRDLQCWQHAFSLAKQVYRLTSQFPDAERFGLISQTRRAAVSVASNIAEGYGRGRTADYLRFLGLARGSLYELETQMLLGLELSYLNQSDYSQFEDATLNCGRLLAGLIRSLEEPTHSH